MANVGAVISSIRNIMRQDRGISGDAQRLEQLGWMLFLKILDDKDQELELIKDNYISVVPYRFRWRNWAADEEGITGDELLKFIDSTEADNQGLFVSLRNLVDPANPKRAAIVKEVFEGSNNYMKSGYEMRKVINKLNEIDFNNSEDKHIFGNIYESILQELRDAGNKGEYYTPRAVTQLMTKMTDPKLNEKVLDPAAGTGGFLTAAIDHVRENYVQTVEDEHVLQKSITGWELKPVAYVLGLTNLILHEMDVPDYHYIDSLKKEYNSISRKDEVDVILANPPFGASIADGVETNFPATFRCKESADLFVVLMLQLLKDNGRCAIVLPDGSITGEGVKARIRERLLTKANLHTIVRLPQSTFFPATVSTNLLFFQKGTPTKEIWYYEHKLPEGQKSYSKTKPIQFEEFAPLMEWWGNRVESDQAYKVKVEDLKGFDLDIKNPFKKEEEIVDPKVYHKKYENSFRSFSTTLGSLLNELGVNSNDIISSLLNNHVSLFMKKEVLKGLKQSILQEAIKGKLTAEWRAERQAGGFETEPASELLKRIQAEKARLIKEKKMKKEKPLPPITEKEKPFELPEGWEWCRLGELCSKTGSGSTPSGGKAVYQKEGVKFIRSQNVYDDGLRLDDVAFITSQIHEKMNGTIVLSEDLLLNITGGSIGRCCIVPRGFDEGNINQHVAIIRPMKAGIGYFLHKIICSPYFQDQIIKAQTGAGREGLPKNKMDNILIGIPSEKEQKAIVEKVESLMAKCQELEIEISQSEQHAQMLMQAVLKEGFEG